ncbi:MAG: response regulator [Eubacteriales bacterium]|nr:response regulator [Eubacteriales bacterium]
MNLLIVDDEYYNVESVRMKVEKLCPVFERIFCAYNLKQALEVFKNEEISIMICDVEMPGGSGLELLNHIRERNLSTICIFLTAYAKFEYISQAMKLSSIDYLLKPVEDEQLLASLEKALAQFRQQQKARSDDLQVSRLKENELNLLLQYCMELLEQEKFDQLEAAAKDYLMQPARSQSSTEKGRISFYQGILTMLSDRFKADGDLDALALFSEQSGLESMERTCASLNSLRQWLPGILALYQNCKQAAANTDNAIAAVKAYIHSHLEEKLDRDTLAAKVYLSPDYLSHCFKRQTGVSLTNYIIGERIEEAKRLLSKKDLNIRDIAISCGFQNISYFTRQFKKSTGMTPREFRGGC